MELHNNLKTSCLVLSDSHGNIPALTAALLWAAKQGGSFAAALFLGDGADDLAAASAETGFSLPWYAVRGNGDMGDSLSAELTVSPGQGGRALFLAHGNRYRLDEGFTGIAAAAQLAGAEAALFGHTHIPYRGMCGGILLLNPGSIGRPRSRTGPSFAVLDCPASGPLSARFYGLLQQGQNYTVRDLEL